MSHHTGAKIDILDLMAAIRRHDLSAFRLTYNKLHECLQVVKTREEEERHANHDSTPRARC